MRACVHAFVFVIVIVIVIVVARAPSGSALKEYEGAW